MARYVDVQVEVKKKDSSSIATMLSYVGDSACL